MRLTLSICRSYALVITACLATVVLSGCTSTYAGRLVSLRGPDVEDYRKLPTREVPNSTAETAPLTEKRDPNWMRTRPIRFLDKDIDSSSALDDFLSGRGTTAFLILHQGRLVDARYYDGYGPESLHKSFSMSKSVLSALFGIAQQEGLISAEDTIGDYLTGFEDPTLADIKLQNLLDNTSGFEYQRGFAPWKQQPRMYYTTDVRGYLRQSIVSGEPGKKYVGEDLSPLLLGWALETAIRRQWPNATLSEYASKKLWGPMGATHDALWVVDREDGGIEKTESGFVARAIDLARFGQLYLDQGMVNGNQIVPRDWIEASVTAPTRGTPTRFVEGFHRNLWWGYFRKNRQIDDFYANGHFGQRIYVSPDKQLVIVRLGSHNGDVDWTEFLARIADAWGPAEETAARQPD